MAQTALDRNVPPAPLSPRSRFSSGGPKLAVALSAGKERMKRLQRSQRLCGYKMAVDGSRWQVLGRSPIRVAPRDAVDNEFIRMADLAKFALRSLQVDHGLVSSWSTNSRRTIAHESGSPIGFLNVA